MLVIDKSQISEILTIDSCIQVMRKVLIDYVKEEAVQELRSVFSIDTNKLLGQMPGLLKGEGMIGTKVITVYPNNQTIGLPSHQGVVLLFNERDGKLEAVVDGTEITAIRTAAVSAVATNILANKNAEVLSLLGSGEQAQSHLEAMLCVRPIKVVKVWSRNKENAALFKEKMSRKFHVPIEIYDHAKEAVHQSDIICTLTASKEPILKGEWVKEGAHINAVGACRANDRELDSELVKRSKLYVDSLESATNESGDYLIPLQEGVIDNNHIIGEIGNLLLGNIEERQSTKQITIFDSLGLAIEDIAAANFVYQEYIKK